MDRNDATNDDQRLKWGRVMDRIPYPPVDPDDRAAALRWLRRHDIRAHAWRWHVRPFLVSRWNAWCDDCVDADDQGQPRPPRDRLSDVLSREWSHALAYETPPPPVWAFEACRKARAAKHGCDPVARAT